MFKRRDWVYTHNPDTGDVTSDSDSDGHGDTTSSEAEDDAASQDQDGESALASDDGKDAVPMRMEDLQEMLDSDKSDERDGDDQDEQNTSGASTALHADTSQARTPEIIENQKATWLQAPEGTTIRGIPLRCLLCKNKLLVNSNGFQSHMKSKVHLAAAKRRGILDDPLEQLESIVAASTQRHHVEETETHRERVERFRQIAEELKHKKQPGASQQAHKPRNKQRKCHWERQDSHVPVQQGDAGTVSSAHDKKNTDSGRKRSERPKRKKPGKRQRLEAKVAAAANAR